MRVGILDMDLSLLITYLKEMEAGYLIEELTWNMKWNTDDALTESSHLLISIMCEVAMF